jgi:formylglycine-generating enzyme required for sulfatase activity
VPKGLRAFDSYDAEFFLSLLPGPRDSNGLPRSVRFWKTSIEETNRSATFSVGVIYGPSGSGKSSLVKAGLLPNLSQNVITNYLEATGDQTEARLLQSLRRCFVKVDNNLGLRETLADLRRGRGVPTRNKVLIVIDQFEQWLHANRVDHTSELIQGLRQCDGGRVQCIVMVRDDFWLATTRFMNALEVDLTQGRNSALVDLFDVDHACHVLAAFGRAFGKLPAGKNTTKQQKEFVNQAVHELAEDGKVACVRLALFAEVMKQRPWDLATLKAVGGIEGIGMTYLEETFSARSAPPKHRLHEQAAQRVLIQLLPESGSNIKGRMISYDELLKASRYTCREDFDDLMKLLDTDLRMVTPVEEEVAGDGWRVAEEKGVAGSGCRVAGDESVPATHHPARATHIARHYQLTHDYLVRALRDWVGRKQRETRRGRAELLLSDRADIWRAKPENHYLPSFMEYLRIASLTARRNWTRTQQMMMNKAARVHGLRWGSLSLTMILVAFGVTHLVSRQRYRDLLARTKTAVAAVASSRGPDVPHAIDGLRDLPPRLARDELQIRFAASPKLSLACGLAALGDVDAEFLTAQIGEVSQADTDNLVSALRVKEAESVRSLHAATGEAAAAGNWRLKARLANILLQLSDSSVARDMCQLRSDPMQRTIFIDETASWHGNLVRLAESARSITDPVFRSALCLGVGNIPAEQRSSEVEDAWNPIVSDWYKHCPDSGSHSAAGWLLRHWGLPLPKLPPPAVGQQWYVIDDIEMTMLKMPAGSFDRNHDSVADPNHEYTIIERDETVSIPHAFYLADREVTVGQFQQFIDDREYPDQEKPKDWPGPDPDLGSPPEHPVQSLNWYDCLLFCNWLSKVEGLKPCYSRTGETVTVGDVEYDAWRHDETADGYRIPTEREWEYACRAGTETHFSMGSFANVTEYDVVIDLLDQYAVYRTDRTERCGSKFPNGWGLFDVHGNVSEFCVIIFDPQPKHSQHPMHRVVLPGNRPTFTFDQHGEYLSIGRGGAYGWHAQAVQSGSRSGNDPRYRHLGFRPARSCP